MYKHLRPSLVLFAILSIITGVIYPLAVTGIAQVVFPNEAEGSIITGMGGSPAGSALIGQEFSAGAPKDAARWFWGRPSATSPAPYTALNLDKGTGSSGSNLAPTNPVLIANVKARIDALHSADAAVAYQRAARVPIPIDLVTSSASGLDPHISIASAEYQVPRVARARALSEDVVRELVRRHSTGRALGVLGEPVVNVLELNLDLQQRTR